MEFLGRLPGRCHFIHLLLVRIGKLVAACWTDVRGDSAGDLRREPPESVGVAGGQEDGERADSGFLGKLGEESEDGLGGLEELDGGAVSDPGVAPAAACHETPDHHASKPDRLVGSP